MRGYGRNYHKHPRADSNLFTDIPRSIRRRELRYKSCCMCSQGTGFLEVDGQYFCSSGCVDRYKFYQKKAREAVVKER